MLIDYSRPLGPLLPARNNTAPDRPAQPIAVPSTSRNETGPE